MQAVSCSIVPLCIERGAGLVAPLVKRGWFYCSMPELFFAVKPSALEAGTTNGCKLKELIRCSTRVGNSSALRRRRFTRDRLWTKKSRFVILRYGQLFLLLSLPGKSHIYVGPLVDENAYYFFIAPTVTHFQLLKSQSNSKCIAPISGERS